MICGQISGSHVNPAITLGVWVRGGWAHMKHHALFATMIIVS